MSNIARRTRSHVSIDDLVLNDNLDFPDVDQNLYQNPNSVSDPEYKDFLYQCYSEAVEQDTNTNTDDNDPAYVYNDDIFSHGWKFNLDEEPLQQQHKEDTYGPEFARILNQQLRQHIQLLTQTYLLAKSMKNMQDEANEAKDHLDSYMKIFKDRQKPSNLLPAIQLVNDFGTPKELKMSVRLSWRPLPVPETVKLIIDQNPNIFPYVELLPQVAFSRLPDKLVTKKPKIIFTLNEDKLLALALNEFKGESSQYAYIASLLLAAKTKLQINNHIKNIKRSSGNEDNPIKLYFSCGRLPLVDLNSDNRLRDDHQNRDQHNQLHHNHHLQHHHHHHHLGNQDHIRGDEAQQYQNSSTICGPASSSGSNDACPTAVASESKINTTDCVVPMSQVAPNSINIDAAANVGPTTTIKIMNFENGEATTPQGAIVNPDDCNLASETMNMDDLMAASTTISKHNNNNISEKSIKSLKLRKSMMDLMSHKFLLSEEMGDLIVHDFLRASQEKLSERNHIHMLQLLTDLMRKEAKKDNSSQTGVKIYNDISKFLKKIEAPMELHERLVLFLNLDAATKCNCALSYLHWMRFFQFIQLVELYHEGEGFEKKLSRLIDALQKEDPHKIKLATSNLINKHPLLKREYEALALNGKPHSSLFICEEDFDDQTEPISLFESRQEDCTIKYEHFDHKLTSEEANYASQSCSCRCHHGSVQQQQQHCSKCNLKFMKGRMYLVNKIKPCLAEWTYIDRPPDPSTPPNNITTQALKGDEQAAPQSLLPPLPPLPPPPPLQQQPSRPHLQQQQLQPQLLVQDSSSALTLTLAPSPKPTPTPLLEWTFEEDKEILEFCRDKAQQNDESVSFDAVTFEELVRKREATSRAPAHKRSALQIAERFNQLMEMYKRDE